MEEKHDKPPRSRSWLRPIVGLFMTDNGGSDSVSSMADRRADSEGAELARARTTLQPAPVTARAGANKGQAVVAPSTPEAAHNKVTADVVARPEWVRQRHAAETKAREKRALIEAERNRKPLGVLLAQLTQQVRAEMGEVGKVSPDTEKRYRSAYARMLVEGKTPDEKARSRAHFDFLRSAWRWCERDAIDRLTRSSERARKRGDLDKAKSRTREAWSRAVAFDVMFLQPNRLGWTTQVQRLKAGGQKPARKSKRFGAPCPSAEAATLALLKQSPVTLSRHEARLAVLALFGLRPSELRKGVVLKVEHQTSRTGKPFLVLTAKIHGAKISPTRGQQVRLCGIRPDNPAGSVGAMAAWLADEVRKAGDVLHVSTTDADIQSLNHALAKAFPGVSCYSFRHRIGSDLKASGASVETVAAFLGHRSTKSQGAYGRKHWGGKGGRFVAKASDPIRLARTARPSRSRPAMPQRTLAHVLEKSPKRLPTPARVIAPVIRRPLAPKPRGF